MIVTNIIRKGVIKVENLSISLESECPQLDKDLIVKIKNIWNGILQKYSEKGQSIWDGTYYRLLNLDEIREGSMHLSLGVIKYSIKMANNNATYIKKLILIQWHQKI